MLLSLKAAGEPMNMQVADSVILLDPWWNPFAEDQAAARAARQGQTQSVLLERMRVKSSIEEYVAEIQVKKRALAASILSDGSNLMETGITEEDLFMLFRPTA